MRPCNRLEHLEYLRFLHILTSPFQFVRSTLGLHCALWPAFRRHPRPCHCGHQPAIKGQTSLYKSTSPWPWNGSLQEKMASQFSWWPCCLLSPHSFVHFVLYNFLSILFLVSASLLYVPREFVPQLIPFVTSPCWSRMRDIWLFQFTPFACSKPTGYFYSRLETWTSLVFLPKNDLWHLWKVCC